METMADAPESGFWDGGSEMMGTTAESSMDSAVLSEADVVFGDVSGGSEFG